MLASGKRPQRRIPCDKCGSTNVKVIRKRDLEHDPPRVVLPREWQCLDCRHTWETIEVRRRLPEGGGQ